MAIVTSYKRARSVARLLTLLCLIGALVIFFQHNVFVRPSVKDHVRRSTQQPADLDLAIKEDDWTTSNNTAVYSEDDNTFRRIHSRAADELTPWERALGNGCNYMNNLESANPTQTQWTDWNVIKDYGWFRTERTVRYDIPASVAGAVLSPKPKGLGAPAPNPEGTGYDPIWVMWDQTLQTTVKDLKTGKSYNPSGGFYQTEFYPSYGIIIADNNLSPKGHIASYPSRWKGGDIVPLAAWSDIVFLEWQNICTLAGQHVSNLQYIFRSYIVNEATQEVIWQALKNVGITDGPPKWPGKEFDMSTNEGKAILGTANGNGVAWIVMSHRAQLGTKTVKSVVVFDDQISDTDRAHYTVWSKPALMFKLEDYTVPPETEAGRKRAVANEKRDSWAELAGGVEDVA
ncbi:hypothetical protein LTR85_002093 [Meristemomyces frigidus]|nr:hypothetical protein LTR85_002093 [Meristemomyces frigidus]